MGLAFCYGAIIADDRIGISALIDRNTLTQYLYMAGIGNGTVEPIQIVVLYFLVSRRFHGVPHAHDLRILGLFSAVGAADDQGSTARTAGNAIHQSFLHIGNRVKVRTVRRGINVAA